MDYDDDKVFPVVEEEDVLDFNSDSFPGGIEDDFTEDDEPLNIGTKLDDEEEGEEMEL
jgi:hypothetical protein